VDHETALQSANQALSSGRRADRSISSVELQSMSTKLHSDAGPRSQPTPDAAPSASSELWQVAGMLVVAVATLSFVVSLWLM
jgi:hypothetical protein